MSTRCTRYRHLLCTSAPHSRVVSRTAGNGPSISRTGTTVTCACGCRCKRQPDPAVFRAHVMTFTRNACMGERHSALWPVDNSEGAPQQCFHSALDIFVLCSRSERRSPEGSASVHHWLELFQAPLHRLHRIIRRVQNVQSLAASNPGLIRPVLRHLGGYIRITS